MVAKGKKRSCCEGQPSDSEHYRVEAIVSVDERGQMVLPKDIRQRMGIAAGEKLAVVIMEREGKPCCLQLLKAQSFSDPVRGMIGTPVSKRSEG